MAQHLFLSQRAQTFQTEFLADDKKFALFLRYQTTHDRGFHKCLADLLKLRAEKRKERLDEAAVCQRAEDSNKAFVSQQHKNAAELRKQAAEKRRAELHPWKVLRADAEAEHRLLLNLNLGSPESPRTDLPERILRAESAAQQAAA